MLRATRSFLNSALCSRRRRGVLTTGLSMMCISSSLMHTIAGALDHAMLLIWLALGNRALRPRLPAACERPLGTSVTDFRRSPWTNCCPPALGGPFRGTRKPPPARSIRAANRKQPHRRRRTRRSSGQLSWRGAADPSTRRARARRHGSHRGVRADQGPASFHGPSRSVRRVRGSMSRSRARSSNSQRAAARPTDSWTLPSARASVGLHRRLDQPPRATFPSASRSEPKRPCGSPKSAWTRRVSAGRHAGLPRADAMPQAPTLARTR